MKKAFLIIGIIGLCLLIAGGATFTAILAKNDWNFNILSNTELEAKTYSVNASEVTAISVDTATMRITYVETESDQVTVDYYNVSTKKGRVVSEFKIDVQSGTLRVHEETKPTFFFSNFSSAEVVVKVPVGKEMPITLKSDTGRIVFGEDGKEIKTPSLTLKTSTGRIEVFSKITCAGKFSAETSTGRIVLGSNVVCADDLSVQTNTGRIECKGAIEAKNVDLRASTGRIVVDAPLKTNKLDVTSSTGDVVARGPVEANEIEIESSTGDVYLTAKGAREDYTFSYETSTGNSNASSFAAGAKTIRIETSTGDIELYFKE